jgi:predicted site-specific integrase-resolvase
MGALKSLRVTAVPKPTLVTTPEAARQLGISARTIQRYVQAGLITPDLRLPSGRYRWDVDRLRDQINSLPVARDDE